VTKMRSDLTPIGDMASLTIVISTIAGWLPAIASLLSIIWLALRCYEAWLNIQEIKRKGQDHGKDD
jgi:hypothetical protein